MRTALIFAGLILVVGCCTQTTDNANNSPKLAKGSGTQIKTFTVDLEFYAFQKQGKIEDVEQAANAWLAEHPDLRILSITPTGGNQFTLTVKYKAKGIEDSKQHRQVKIFEKDLEFYAFQKQGKIEDVERAANVWLAGHPDAHIIAVTPASGNGRHSITIEYEEK